MTDQADVRCPKCSALVRAGSPWCTLCYADLRPQPVAVRPSDPADLNDAPGGATYQPAREPAPSYAAAGSAFDPLTAPLSMIEGVAADLQQPTAFAAALPAPVVDRLPAVAAAPAKEPAGWPCSRCATLVSFDDMACTTCGTPFLAGAAGEADLIARIGRGGLSKTTKALIVGGGSLVIIMIVVSLMYLASLFF